MFLYFSDLGVRRYGNEPSLARSLAGADSGSSRLKSSEGGFVPREMNTVKAKYLHGRQKLEPNTRSDDLSYSAIFS